MQVWSHLTAFVLCTCCYLSLECSSPDTCLLARSFSSFESLLQVAFSTRLPRQHSPSSLAAGFCSRAFIVPNVHYNLLIYLVCGQPPLTNVSSTRTGSFVCFVHSYVPCACNSAWRHRCSVIRKRRNLPTLGGRQPSKGIAILALRFLFVCLFSLTPNNSLSW